MDQLEFLENWILKPCEFPRRVRLKSSSLDDLDPYFLKKQKLDIHRHRSFRRKRVQTVASLEPLLEVEQSETLNLFSKWRSSQPRSQQISCRNHLKIAPQKLPKRLIRPTPSPRSVNILHIWHHHPYIPFWRVPHSDMRVTNAKSLWSTSPLVIPLVGHCHMHSNFHKRWEKEWIRRTPPPFHLAHFQYRDPRSKPTDIR